MLTGRWRAISPAHASNRSVRASSTGLALSSPVLGACDARHGGVDERLVLEEVQMPSHTLPSCYGLEVHGPDLPRLLQLQRGGEQVRGIHASNPIRLATPHTTATHHKQRKAQLLSCPTLTFLIQLTSANVMHLYASSQKVIDFFMYI